MGSSQAASFPSSAAARPVASEVLAFEKALRSRKLPLPALRQHAPQLAFGKGTLGQLTKDALRVFDTGDFQLLAEVPLESPRAVVALADGALLAIGAKVVLRWEREKRRPTTLPRPVLLPTAQIYADAQQPDTLWVFDAQGRGAGAPTLQLYRLLPGSEALPLPEQSIELGTPAGGSFGVTREGVWLYVTPGQGERFGPGGARLSKLALGDAALPTWVLPARRLDQSLWVAEHGQVSRVLVSPTYKLLGTAQLSGKAIAADAGDEGRLLAVVLVTDAEPRFELALLDQDLAARGRAALPADEPTTGDDWVKAVTANQQVAVAARASLVAVGGPARLTIFDASAKPVFSIPSK
ncbi:MAG TPA: hypothetical protein VHP33_22885 [Polyangiaceae bacterium]|nr:hypothetical protein [Polyangiaceae bacterium]